MTTEIDIFWGRCAAKTREEIENSLFLADREFPQPHWTPQNTCSHCRGIRPSIAMEAIRSGAKVEPTDKNYKMYVVVPDPDVGKSRICAMRNGEPASGLEHWIKVTEELKSQHPHLDFGEHWEWVQLDLHKETYTAKCYFNHFSESQAVELVRLYEEGKINLDYPGKFYSGLCFGIYKDALELDRNLRNKNGEPSKTSSD